MKANLQNLFSEHPASVGESYSEHFAVAAGYSARLFAAALAAMVHSFFPFLFKNTASRAITEMHREIVRRKTGPQLTESAQAQVSQF
jgi:hypothetical protein